MNLKLNKTQRKAILLVLVVSVAVPAIAIPTASASHHFERHVGYRGNFQAKERWWIFYFLKLDVQMWVSADIWYSDTLMGWFFMDVYWYCPNIQIHDGNFRYSDVTIINAKKTGGLYIFEISQTIELKLSKGSLYRWVTFELVMNTGNGLGHGEVTCTLGSGNLNLYWSKNVLRLNDILEPFLEYEQGNPFEYGHPENFQ